MFEILIPTFTFLSILSLGIAVVAMQQMKRQAMRDRLIKLNGHVLPKKPSGVGAGLQHAMRDLGARISGGAGSHNLQQQMVRAGFHGAAAASIYMGIKILLLLLGGLGIGIAILPLHLGVPLKAALIVMVAGLLFFLPNAILAARRRKRSIEVRSNLPDVVDLLEVGVSSGMSLDMAWNLVTDEIRRVSTTLADEMALSNLEIHLGAPRVVAMRNFAQRTGVEEISSLVAVLVQSEQFGTSVAEALRVFAATMRDIRSSRAQELAEGMAVKLLFPMILLIFPALMVVLVGPAGIGLYQLFAGQ